MPVKSINAVQLIVGGVAIDLAKAGDRLGDRPRVPAGVASKLAIGVAGGVLVTHLFGTTNIGRLITLKAAPYEIDLPVLAAGGYKLVIEHNANGNHDAAEILFDVATDVKLPAAKPGSPATPPARKMKLGLVDGSRVALPIARWLIEPLKLYSVRPWINTRDFTPYKPDTDVARAIEYLAAGVVETVIFCCAQSKLKRKLCEGAPAWYLAFARDAIRKLDNNPKTNGMRLRVEIHNEPDLDGGAYWDGSVADYVASYQMPVHTALKKEFGDRVETISAGLSWKSDELERNADAIAANCDAMAFHGYPKSQSQLSRLTAAVQTAQKRSKRLILTEAQYNFAGKAYPLAQRQADITAYLQHCEQIGVDELLYFVAYDAGTPNSWAALMEAVTDGKKTIGVKARPYYSTFANFVQGGR